MLIQQSEWEHEKKQQLDGMYGQLRSQLAGIGNAHRSAYEVAELQQAQATTADKEWRAARAVREESGRGVLPGV